MSSIACKCKTPNYNPIGRCLSCGGFHEGSTSDETQTVTPTLTPQLQAQIEQEAKDCANLEICDWGKIQGDDQLSKWELAHDVYRDAAEPYALKWQKAEQRAARYEKALFEIQFKATSAIFPHLPVETIGAQMCIEIEKVATEALTPKQTTDDTVNG